MKIYVIENEKKVIGKLKLKKKEYNILNKCCKNNRLNIRFWDYRYW